MVLVRRISVENKGQNRDCMCQRKSWRRGNQDNKNRQHATEVWRKTAKEQLDSSWKEFMGHGNVF